MRSMNISLTIAAALIASPLALAAGTAAAATAHNSQAGSVGPSSNAGDSTVGSRRVKHSAKHGGMRKPM